MMPSQRSRNRPSLTSLLSSTASWNWGPTPEHGSTLDVTEARGIGPGVWIVPFGAGPDGDSHLLAYRVYRDYPRIRLLSFTPNAFE